MLSTPLNNPAALLQKHQAEIGPVVAFDLNSPQVAKLDFSEANQFLTPGNLRDTEKFNEVVNQMLAEKSAQAGIGGYLENRVIYRRSNLFEETQEARCMHLGVDIWAPARTDIFAPLPATVHSFQDNANFGDYGPTIILAHELEGQPFYTLYGHLNRLCLQDLHPGKAIEKGQKIGEFGPYPENGDWPPHLHFQIITDMLGLKGDFPGVCKPTELAKYAAICPDPNLILNSRHLR